MDSVIDSNPATSTAITVIEPDWKSIRERYLEGELVKDIAADNAVTANAIYIRAHKEKWKLAQFDRLLRDERLISNEVRNCLMVSVLKEARFFQAQDPAEDPAIADSWSRVRSRLVETASKLLHWDVDPVANAKRAKAIDV